MPNIFSSLVDLIEDALGRHDTDLKPVLDAIAGIAKAQADNEAAAIARHDVLVALIQTITKTQADNAGAVASIQSRLDLHTSMINGARDDLLSIKAFLGIPDARIGATQDQIDALGAAVQAEVKEIEQFDQTLQTTPNIERGNQLDNR